MARKTIHMPDEELYRRIKVEAARMGCSVSELVESLIQRFLDYREDKGYHDKLRSYLIGERPLEPLYG